MLFTKEILFQAAVVLVEVVFFAMGIVGIKVTVSKVIRKGIAVSIVETIKSCPRTLIAIKNFVSSWTVAKGVLNQAWAIWGLLKGMSVSILWVIVKACINGMSIYDWLKTIAIFSTTIIASFATDGLAMVIKIALGLISAVDLLREIGTLVKLVLGK